MVIIAKSIVESRDVEVNEGYRVCTQCGYSESVVVVVVLHPFQWRKHAIKRWGREKIPASLMQDSFGYDTEEG